MAQFLADIAGILEVAAIAAGLALLHRAGQDAAAKLLKAAGWVLVVGGIAVGACTTYYWIRYQSSGEFDYVHPGAAAMMRGGGPWAGPGPMGPGLGRGMMGRWRGRMGPGMMGPGTAPAPETAPPSEQEKPESETK